LVRNKFVGRREGGREGGRYLGDAVGFVDDKPGEQAAVFESLQALEHGVRPKEGGREGGRVKRREGGREGVREGRR